MIIFAVIVGISILILIHELGHFLAAKKMGLKVEEFGFGFPPRLFSKKVGETVYSLNALPFGGFVKLEGEEAGSASGFATQSAWKRALVIVAGVGMNFILGWFLFSAIFLVGTPKTLLVSEVMTDSPAEKVGILANDQLVGFENAAEFISFINKNRGKEITLKLQREGEPLEVKAIPRVSDEAALGVAVVEAGIEKQPFFQSILSGLKTSVKIMLGISTAFLNLIFGLLTQGKVVVDFVGPIGIFGVASQAGALGFLYLLQLFAMISLNLAVLNIFPFPALDGGRLLFLLIEKVKGSPLPANFERSANAFGFILLLILMIAITVRDVVKLF